MGLLKLLLEEISPDQKDKLENMGIEIIEDFQVGEYQLVLIKSHIYPVTPYSIGVQRKGLDFTDSNQQMEHIIPDAVSLEDGHQILIKAVEWVKEYGKIIIGSYNDRKNKMYKLLLQRKGVTVKDYPIHGVNAMLISMD